jgi:hypothetical protein
MQQFYKFIYYLTFMFRWTFFGRLHAHHQELTTALADSGFTLERGGINVMSKITGLNCWLDSKLEIHFTTIVPV